MTITEVEEYCDQKSEEMKSKLSLLAQSRETVKAIKETKEIGMQSAYESSDPKAFIKSQSEFTEAEASEEFYAKKIKDIECSPLFTLEEYNRLVSIVKNELDRKSVEDGKKILKYAEKILAIGKENAKAIEEGNALIHHMQFDLMHDDAIIRDSHGHGFGPGMYKDEYRSLSFNVPGMANRIYEIVSFLNNVNADE